MCIMNGNGNKDNDERNNNENDPGIANSRNQVRHIVLTIAVTQIVDSIMEIYGFTQHHTSNAIATQAGTLYFYVYFT